MTVIRKFLIHLC